MLDTNSCKHRYYTLPEFREGLYYLWCKAVGWGVKGLCCTNCCWTFSHLGQNNLHSRKNTKHWSALITTNLYMLVVAKLLYSQYPLRVLVQIFHHAPQLSIITALIHVSTVMFLWLEFFRMMYCNVQYANQSLLN